MKSRFNKLNYSLLLPLLLLGCVAGKHRIKPVEKTLGKGWQCYIAPDEFKIAGVVIEQTPEGKYYVDDTTYIRNASIGEAAIPDNSYQSNLNVGILANFNFYGTKLNTGNDFNKNSTVDIKYTDTKKQVIIGTVVNNIIKDYKTREFNIKSKYYLIRESYTAKSADIFISKSLADSLNISLTDSIKINGNGGNNRKYVLKKEFSKSLAICNLIYELKIEKGFDSKNIVTIGNPVVIPTNTEFLKK